MLTTTPIATTNGKAMDETKLQKYKTDLCQRMLRSGTCRYGLQCDFAHDKLELRRNLQQHWYYGQKCPKENCEENECRYAHNEIELMYHPHIFKTQLCHSIAFGPCLKKHYCPFAHGPEELRQGKFDPENERTRLYFPPSAFSESMTTTTSSPLVSTTPSYLNGDHNNSSSVPNSPRRGAAATNSRDFREVTDRLKIQLLDLVDEIASMHFDHARQMPGPKSHVLEQLSQFSSNYFQNLPRTELDIMAAQCHAVLDMVAQARVIQEEDASGSMYLA